VVAFMHHHHHKDFNQVARGPARETENFFRLFMAPGLAHCIGATGLNTFDTLTALERWVEQGTAPNKIIASQVTNGVTTMTRPLCPYPQVATYTEHGSTNDAANFVCGLPRHPGHDDDREDPDR